MQRRVEGGGALGSGRSCESGVEIVGGKKGSVVSHSVTKDSSDSGNQMPIECHDTHGSPRMALLHHERGDTRKERTRWNYPDCNAHMQNRD